MLSIGNMYGQQLIQPRYEALCSITQKEIDSCITDAISEMAEEYSCSFEEMRAQLKRQYDGYHFNENVNELTGKYYSPAEFIDYKADVERPLPMIFQSGYLTILESYS
ncbi:AAA family ATPase [Bacteroides caecigallinarum]|nr:AAA family ATPase [Bacteroides caecigallinarum]